MPFRRRLAMSPQCPLPQTLPQSKPKTMAVTVVGELRPGVSAKDLILALITQTGTGGGNGHIVEYRGDAIRKLSMEGRMTICNMSIEWGAKAGLIAPDDTTFAYLRDRSFAPQGPQWNAALAYWRSLRTDDGARFDRTVRLDVSGLTPFVTWGTHPGQAAPLDGRVPGLDSCPDEASHSQAPSALCPAPKTSSPVSVWVSKWTRATGP